LDPGVSQSSAGVFAELGSPSIRLAELPAKTVGLLQVVAGELVDVSGTGAPLLEAVDEALVELGAEALRGSAVYRLL
jgi:hypothetical protein